MNSIEYLEGLGVVGNNASDRVVFLVAHEILMGVEFCILDKLRALRCIYRAMGMMGEISEGAVEEYCRSFV